jgi:hypothetical protein
MVKPRKFRFTFVGCRKGAIGERYRIVAVRTGVDVETARLALYDEFDHIHGAVHEELPNDAS